MKTVAIIQARLASTRLPGKVLLDLGGKTILQHVYDRTLAAEVFDDVVIATSDDSDDDSIAEYCKEHCMHCVRGSHNDVLDRYFAAAKESHADVVVRITADCPLIDPDVTRQAVEMYQSKEFDYVSNVIERTYPDGLDVEVFGFDILKQVHEEAALPSEREHVTPFIHGHPERFTLGCIKQNTDQTMYRFTVDEPRDLKFLRALHLHLREGFTTADVFEVLRENPSLMHINEDIATNEGMQKSYEEDAKFLEGNV